jgi:hypothetical protein
VTYVTKRSGFLWRKAAVVVNNVIPAPHEVLEPYNDGAMNGNISHRDGIFPEHVWPLRWSGREAKADGLAGVGFNARSAFGAQAARR